MVEIKVTGLKGLQRRFHKMQDITPISKALHARLSGTWRAGAAIFIKTVLENIHRDTGMSGATLYPLARIVKNGSLGQIRAFLANATSGPKQDRPEFPSGARRKPARERSIREGIIEGESAYQIEYGTPKRPVFTFRFRTVVFQFAFYEDERNALPKGEEAFKAYVEKKFFTKANELIGTWLETGQSPIVRIDL